LSQSLELFPIGNCAASALIDEAGSFVWACAPRVDGDPFFSALLGGDAPQAGYWSIEAEGQVQARQSYLRNTPILRTELTDASGASLEIIDFCPRYRQFGRTYRPLAFVRIVRPLVGTPRIRVRLRPAVNYGEQAAATTIGSNHIRFVGGETTLRMTTNAPVSHIHNERLFRLETPIAMFLGPDEGFDNDVGGSAARMLRETQESWRAWVRTLSVPLEWQEAVIRAAITLKLCAYEEGATGTTGIAGSVTPITWCRP
jgi:GH15 family glucan-1,4-alpha-glucosidase